MSFFPKPAATTTTAAPLFGNTSATAGTPAPLFGNTSTPAATGTTPGGLFSGGAAKTPGSGFNLFGGAGAGAGSTSSASPFGSTTPAAAPAPFSLFGGATSSATPTPATTTAPLFGGAAGTTTPAAGGLFGPKPGAATTSTPGLFGSGTTTTTAPAPGGLFNAATATSQAPAAPLFGGTTPATSQSAAGGLFNPTSAAPAAPTLGGLFQKPAAPAAGGGLFPGASTTTQPAAGGLFSTSTIAPGANAQQNAAPTAAVDITRLTPTTRFAECHESVQKELEMLESVIQQQISISDSLNARFPAHRNDILSIPTDASVLSHRLATTKLFQASDQAAYDSVRSLHDADNAASDLSVRSLDLFRLPHAQRSQYIQRSLPPTSATTAAANPQRENDITSNKPMVKYFNGQADEMERKLGVIRRSVREVEESLRSVEMQAVVGGQVGAGDLVSGGAQGRQDARRLNRTLREFNEALKDVSARIVDAREGLQKVTGRA
ncbi:hypothetical protein EX30DRAFT_360875 [Ascodesmis nigricans]|uniref:Nucleoporin Nup54 alpha-helical domain-containing protein n=1 Tax=Ascodesmis nigricans TaxID=341454 RepID=A0A4S2N6N6_9PEZI|nr:hypothetical protein EX30DRAFT_360875 [Ascodesmis nigricans]